MRENRVIEVEELEVCFRLDRGVVVDAVKGISFHIDKGETVALVGESGSGKSVTAMSLMRLIENDGGEIVSGKIALRGRSNNVVDIHSQTSAAMQDIRGADVSMIFQEPMTSLNPVLPIGFQISEAIMRHQNKSKNEATNIALETLRLVRVPEPESRLGQYPHNLSGGMRQRVMIAMALLCEPKLLIADEPTTALDVTIQAQILHLTKDLQKRTGAAVIFITHDIALASDLCDSIAVMYAGEIVEIGSAKDMLTRPQHPYTQMLLSAESSGSPEPVEPNAEVVAETKNLKIWFPIHKGLLKRTVGHVKAVNDASISVRAGETVGIVGESGSGKTTLALAIMRLIQSEGGITYRGQNVRDWSTKELRRLRSEMQIVFQDPFGSLSPRMTCEQIIAEGLGVHGSPDGRSKREHVIEVMTEVGLDPATMHRYPHEFSGGQRQRIAIARAMVLRPRLVVLDEPTSALDMTVQVQIVNLLRDLQRKYDLAYLFISHDLRVVRAMSHKVLVMKQGDVVEMGTTEDIFDRPQTAYTQELISAAFGPAVAAE